LFPQAQRDTDTLDLGYHYDPLDYAIDACVTNATITVLPGTALAGYAGSNGGNYGIWLCTNGVINCAGTATSPNYFVQYNTVQEQSTTNWADTDWSALLITPDAPDSSSANFNFTEWSILTSANQITGLLTACPVTLGNCQFYGGSIAASSGPVLAVTNCLFRRDNFTMRDSALGNVSLTLENNLFWQGEVTVRHMASGIFTVRDNLFDRSTNTMVTGTLNYSANNAYVTTNYGLLTPETNDVILTSPPSYQTGALGSYYYPGSLTSLIYKGSQLASAAGLYHYTVLTNLSSTNIEGTNIVSIGFHYVGVGTNGMPISTPGDGIPDYIADANGNGIVDPGEISWTNYVSLNGLITPSGLVVYTRFH
jgi:hypothetical protein